MSIIAFWLIQVPGWLLLAYLVAAQCTAAVGYALGVRMGTQEPAHRITEVGVAFFKGYVGADLVFYTPLLGLGLLGHFFGSSWADVALGAALGVTVYWPIACLWTVKVRAGRRWLGFAEGRAVLDRAARNRWVGRDWPRASAAWKLTAIVSCLAMAGRRSSELYA